MTWKPTDEMVQTVDDEANNTLGSQLATRILTAVQPLIAAQARAKALEEAAQYCWGREGLAGASLAEGIRSLIPKPVEGR